jgi:hypothetical protein
MFWAIIVLPRPVADDWLVSLDTNRYSVPFTLIGQAVEIHRRNGRLRILHRGGLVAEHPELHGKYQLRILPDHGPGASARTVRARHSTAPSTRAAVPPPAVEIRDLAVYDALLGDPDTASPLVKIAPGAAGPLGPMPAVMSA